MYNSTRTFDLYYMTVPNFRIHMTLAYRHIYSKHCMIYASSVLKTNVVRICLPVRMPITRYMLRHFKRI